MFGSSGRVTNAGQLFPNGMGNTVDGGFEISGAWNFGSGVAHSPFISGGFMKVVDGEPILDLDQFSVAVLDSSGNLIMRIGKYGNVDDGLPLSKNQKLVAPNPRPLGGDEVALMHPSHVATMTDRYLYIGDVGNARVVQVKLGYHAEAKIRLKNIPDK